MEDITPLNLEDHPKLFGMRYDQLIAILISLIVGTQFYSWMNPLTIGSVDVRLTISMFLGILGPAYCLITIHNSAGYWGNMINFYMSNQEFIPGPDPNPVRFLVDEKLADIYE